MSYIYGATAGFIDMVEAETSSSELDLPINQPHDFSFPQRQFGKSKIVYRSFQSQWFHKWKWFHYDAASDAALCYICMNAVQKNKMPHLEMLIKPLYQEVIATRKMLLVRRGTCHKIASGSCMTPWANLHYRTEVMITLPKNTQNVAELMSSSYVQEKRANRMYLFRGALSRQFRILQRCEYH